MYKNVPVVNLTSHQADPRSFKTSTELVPSDVLLGIEIELENCPIKELSDTSIYWAFTYDDSLRGDDAVEARFSLPLGTFDTIKALTELENYIISNDLTPIISYRTSTHVHVDVRSLDTNKLTNFILLSLFMEPVLFAYCRKYRSLSPFSLPITDKQEVIHNIRTNIQSKDLSFNVSYEMMQKFSDGYRYAGINFAALRKFGSIEYRMLQGCYSTVKLKAWINILISIYETAIAYEDPKDILKDIHKFGLESFVKRVLPDNTVIDFNYKLRSNMKEALLLVRELTHPTEIQMAEWDVFKILSEYEKK